MEALFAGSGDEDPAAIRAEMKEAMIEKVGIFRDEPEMRQAADKIKELQGRYLRLRPLYRGTKFNLDLLRNYQLRGQLDVAEVIAAGALARTESRGSHSRRDYPKRDDVNWLKHTIAHYSPEGPVLTYKPVAMTKYQPEERKY